MKLDDNVYAAIKWIALIFLPALESLTAVILSLWDICDAGTITAIVGTISAVDVFLGALIGVSTLQYKNDKLIGKDDSV